MISKVVIIYLLVGITNGNDIEILIEDQGYNYKYSNDLLPSLTLATNINNENYGEFIFKKLNYNDYDLMLYGYNSKNGIRIYKIYKKDSDYNYTGFIANTKKDGYRLSINNIKELDNYLLFNNYKLYGNNRKVYVINKKLIIFYILVKYVFYGYIIYKIIDLFNKFIHLTL